MSKITNDGRLNTVWHRMLYSCTHMATVGVKGLAILTQSQGTLYNNALFYNQFKKVAQPDDSRCDIRPFRVIKRL